MAAREAGRAVQGDAAGAFRAALREGVDRPVHAAQKEGLAPEARRRRARGRDHRPHSPQLRPARDGRHERAAGDGGKGAVARDEGTLAKTGRPGLVYLGRLYLAKLIRRQFRSQNNDLHSSVPPCRHHAGSANGVNSLSQQPSIHCPQHSKSRHDRLRT